MSARNQSESSPQGGGAKLPVLQPEGKKHAATPEVVWSSPVSTGAGFGAVAPDNSAAHKPEEDASPAWSNRYVYAFESDLLDNAFVHWENNELTLEMIPGFKQDVPPAELDYLYPAETVASGLGDLLGDGTDGSITQIDTDWSDPARPFQPSENIGAPGPMKVREDGIEDPLTGWRPTGMVFFETLSAPPRGTVYSSSLLEAFNENSSPSADSLPPPLPAGSVKAADLGDVAPFFDFPDTVAPAPPEETEDFPLAEVVVKGGGGGGGVRMFKLFARLVLLLVFFLGLGAMALAGSYIWYLKHRLYDAESRGQSITLIVKPGQNFRSVIDGMKEEGLLGSFLGLDDRYIMRYLAYAYENSDKVKPGVYRFNSGQNLSDVYDRLIAGSKDFKLTIPEGKTAKEVGELVAKQYKNFDSERFMQLVYDPKFAGSLGIQAASLEGYLYPSTYYFGPGMKEEELIKLMVGTFQDKVETVLKDKLTSTGYSFQEHVIMASLIEREARMDEDRPLIASVILNRLDKGIPLQIDATVNYALNDWRRLNNSDYKTDHPYNTYKIKGLPPGPIASPRIESLAATFEAPVTDFLYYVHKGDGHHAFAETYAQHLANVGRYIREKNAPGMGNAPSPEALVNGATKPDKAPAVAGDESDAKLDKESADVEKSSSEDESAENEKIAKADSKDENAETEDSVIDIRIESAEAESDEADMEEVEENEADSKDPVSKEDAAGDNVEAGALAKPKSY